MTMTHSITNPWLLNADWWNPDAPEGLRNFATTAAALPDRFSSKLSRTVQLASNTGEYAAVPFVQDLIRSGRMTGTLTEHWQVRTAEAVRGQVGHEADDYSLHCKGAVRAYIPVDGLEWPCVKLVSRVSRNGVNSLGTDVFFDGKATLKGFHRLSKKHPELMDRIISKYDVEFECPIPCGEGRMALYGHEWLVAARTTFERELSKDPDFEAEDWHITMEMKPDQTPEQVERAFLIGMVLMEAALAPTMKDQMVNVDRLKRLLEA